MKRMFFALDIAPKDKAIIASWRSFLETSAKPVASNNFHVTLAFLGLVPQSIEQKLIDHLGHANNTGVTKAYQLQLASIGLFQKPQVLYLGFNHFPPELSNLAQYLTDLAKAHKLKQEARTYLPHLTIFRKAKALPLATPLNHQFEVSSFSLYHSQSSPTGVQYLPVATWPIQNM